MNKFVCERDEGGMERRGSGNKGSGSGRRGGRGRGRKRASERDSDREIERQRKKDGEGDGERSSEKSLKSMHYAISSRFLSFFPALSFLLFLSFYSCSQ